MMSFKHFLAEQLNQDLVDLSNKSADDIVALIETHCSEILEIYKKAKKHYLYRGTNKRGDALISGIRQNRKPVELNPAMQKVTDSVIAKMGGKAGRSNSIFCTTDFGVANDWSKDGSFPKIIFPKDGWAVTYFTKFKPEHGDYVFDLLSGLYEYYWEVFASEFDTVKEKKNKILPKLEYYSPLSNKKYVFSNVKFLNLKTYLETIASEILEKDFNAMGIGFDKSGLVQCLKQMSEILITGSSYLMLDAGSDKATEVLKKLGLKKG